MPDKLAKISSSIRVDARERLNMGWSCVHIGETKFVRLSGSNRLLCLLAFFIASSSVQFKSFPSLSYNPN